MDKKWQYRAAKKHLNSNIKYPDFAWTNVGSVEYLNAIDDIHAVYRKILEISKAAEGFHDKECPMCPERPNRNFKNIEIRWREITEITSRHQIQNWAIFALIVKYYHTLTSMGKDLHTDFQPTGK